MEEAGTATTIPVRIYSNLTYDGDPKANVSTYIYDDVKLSEPTISLVRKDNELPSESKVL